MPTDESEKCLSGQREGLPANNATRIVTTHRKALGSIFGFLAVLFCVLIESQAATFDSNSAIFNNSYYPLNVGAKWTYRGTGFLAGRSASHQATTVETVDGVRCIKVTETGPDGTIYSWYAQDTSGAAWQLRNYDPAISEYDEEDYLMMPVNPVPGSRYTLWMVDYEVVSTAATVTTPAGTFTQCLHVRSVDDSWPGEEEYYAPGIGFVKGTDSMAGYELTSSTGISISPPSTAPTITTSGPLPAGTAGTAYSKTLAATGGTTPYTWLISAGSLPAGLNLSSAGVISGTPSAAITASFTVKVIGNNSLFSTKAFTLAIDAVQVNWAPSSLSGKTMNVVIPGKGTAVQTFDVSTFTRTGFHAAQGTYSYTRLDGSHAQFTSLELSPPEYNGNQSTVDLTFTSSIAGTFVSHWQDAGPNGDSGVIPGTFSLIVDTTKPTLTIIAPILNQRWSNEVFTVMGNASDNIRVAAVWCKLNTNDWALATTANSWTNWTAGVTLVPGTNTVSAYAVDASGNRSATNSQKMVYVLCAPISFNVVGNGKMTGATNGQLLEIGKNVSLTATAGTGCQLTNWLVQVAGLTVISTNRVVPFTMQSNLVLTATFTDITKPVLTITSPTLNQRWSNEVFTVAGKVTDNGPVASVACQLNGGAWNIAQTGNGWSNWTAQVNLAPGTNTVRAFALDAAGNGSITNSQKVVFVATYWLPDYYYSATAGNRWIYDGKDGVGNPAQMEARIDNTNFPITCYSGTAPVRSYQRNVIKVGYADGTFNLGSGAFDPYDDWDEYITLTNGWGIFGSEDTSESMRIDPGFVITNRITVGQTVTQTINAYLAGVYQGQATLKFQLLDVVNVTVPAGTFTGCLHVRTTRTLGGNSQVQDQWWAKSLGMVKKQGVSGGGSALYFELIQYSLVSAPPIVARLQFEFGNGGMSAANGRLTIQLSGSPVAVVAVENSPDLVQWAPIQTNTVPAEGLSLSIPIDQHPGQFFRTRLLP